MYTLFNNEPLTRGNGFSYPQFDYARDVLLRNANRWAEYRRQNVAPMVPSDHLLVKTLQSLNIPYTGDLYRYRSLVEQRVGMFTGSLGYSSSLYKGKPFQGRQAVFYGEEAMEIIIATDEDFELGAAGNTWQHWEPVRVLSHYRSDLGIETLDGKSSTSESGLAVIAVNVVMLACQWKLFQEEQQNYDHKLTMQQFLYMFPLTNAIYSHLDVAVFNRLCRRFDHKPVGETYRRSPFNMANVDDKVDYALDQVIDRNSKTRLTFIDLLRNLPGVVNANQFDVHRLPKMAATYRVQWALTAARLNLVSFLLKFAYETDNERNPGDIMAIRRNLQQAESNKSLVNGLPPNLADYFQLFIGERITPYL